MLQKREEKAGFGGILNFSRLGRAASGAGVCGSDSDFGGVTPDDAFANLPPACQSQKQNPFMLRLSFWGTRCRVCLTFRDTSLIHPRTFIHPTKPHSEPRLHGRPSFQRREGRHGVDVARLSSTPRPRTRPCDTVIHLSFVGSVESRGLMVPPNMQIEGDGVRGVDCKGELNGARVR